MSEEECTTGSQFKSHLQSLLLQKDRQRVMKHLDDAPQCQQNNGLSSNIESTDQSRNQTVPLAFLAELTTKAPALVSVEACVDHSTFHEQKSAGENFKSKLAQLIGNRASSIISLQLAAKIVGPRLIERSHQTNRPAVKSEGTDDDMIEAIQASFANITVIGNDVTLMPAGASMERTISNDGNLHLSGDSVEIVETVEQTHSSLKAPGHDQKDDQLISRNKSMQEPELHNKHVVLDESSSGNESREQKEPTCLTEHRTAGTVMIADTESEGRSSKYWQAQCIRLAKEIRDMEKFEANLILLLDRFPKSDVLQMLGISPQKPIVLKPTLLLKHKPGFLVWSAVRVILAFMVLFILLCASWIRENKFTGPHAGLLASSNCSNSHC